MNFHSYAMASFQILFYSENPCKIEAYKIININNSVQLNPYLFKHMKFKITSYTLVRNFYLEFSNIPY